MNKIGQNNHFAHLVTSALIIFGPSYWLLFRNKNKMKLPMSITNTLATDSDIRFSVGKYRLSKSSTDVSNMASIYLVDIDSVPIYTQYFDISLIPSTLFFFNGQHIKIDWGTQDHTKFIGSFKSKQDFIDVVETIYRGAMKGKVMVTSPLDPRNIPKYHLIYKDI